MPRVPRDWLSGSFHERIVGPSPHNVSAPGGQVVRHSPFEVEDLRWTVLRRLADVELRGAVRVGTPAPPRGWASGGAPLTSGSSAPLCAGRVPSSPRRYGGDIADRYRKATLTRSRR